MIENEAPDRSHDPERGDLDQNAEDALAPDGSLFDEVRHYLHDPDRLLEHGRDDDERAEDELLELDQTELVELGLLLDDPHQPESE